MNQLELLSIKQTIKSDKLILKKGNVYIMAGNDKQLFLQSIMKFISKTNDKSILKAFEFLNFNACFKQAKKDIDFKTLIIVRFGGIGDLIALSSICQYFKDKTIHFITQKKYFPVFEWFEQIPGNLSTPETPLFSNFKKTDLNFRLQNTAKYHGEGIVELGAERNWFDIFLEQINVTDTEYFRPILKKERISDAKSNLSGCYRKTLLICNKSSAMMRSIHLSDILECLNPKTIHNSAIFVYRDNLSENDLIYLEETKININIIESTNFETFLLDCYDADLVISVDTGALHFREGIEKPAIGLYNSFTTDSRTKYYKFTKSFDIKSECELQPCFIHETINSKFCPKGTAEMFASPCFDSRYNKTLHSQLNKIFMDL